MNIRSAAKAVIVRDGCVLLVQSKMPSGAVYYDLPGGGQRPGETMEEAVLRECLEETGYTVRIVRFLALAEEILTDEALVTRYPGYAHRIFHVFQCELTDVPQAAPTEEDFQQTGTVWMPLEEVAGVALRPDALRTRLTALLEDGHPAFVGSKRIARIM